MANINITVTVTAVPPIGIPAIPIDIEVHAEARGLDELWTGRTSADTRRRLQNRLNQRAYRRRRAEEKATRVQVFDLGPEPVSDPLRAVGHLQDTSGAHDCAMPSEKAGELSQARFQQGYLGTQNPSVGGELLRPTTSWCRPFEAFIGMRDQSIPIRPQGNPDEIVSDTVSFEESFLHNLKPADLFRLPADDHLLSLMYYNVFRALTTNARLLGLDTLLMHTDTYPSPFITGAAYSRHIPPHLQPTQLQQTVPHHPCFDIFPDPVVRDRAIRSTHLLPHGILCMTLAGRNTWNENDRPKRKGLVIWGPPEDATSWEVTEGFVANWGWLVRGSLMLQTSTNRWRAVRGEAAIFFA